MLCVVNDVVYNKDLHSINTDCLLALACIMVLGGLIKNMLDPLGLTVNDDMGYCFVTSGTSAVGYRVARDLLDAGYKHVRVGMWKGKRQDGVEESTAQRVLDELEAKGATVIHFDWTKEDNYTMALAGVRSVFCTIPRTRDSPETFEKFVHHCNSVGVEHFVKASVFSVLEKDDPYIKFVPRVSFEHKCDNFLTGTNLTSRMTYTVLRSSHLMSDPMIQQGPVLRKDHEYISASYAMGVNYVSPNDIARAAIVVLINRKEYRNKTYTLIGPYPLADRAVADLLGNFYGRKIKHVAIGYREIKDVLKDRGFPDWLITDIAGNERAKASGVDEHQTSYEKDLEELIGKRPESFKAYLADKESMSHAENPRHSKTHSKQPSASVEV